MAFDRTVRKYGCLQSGYCVFVSSRTVKYYSSLHLNTLIHCSTVWRKMPVTQKLKLHLERSCLWVLTEMS